VAGREVGLPERRKTKKKKDDEKKRELPTDGTSPTGGLKRKEIQCGKPLNIVKSDERGNAGRRTGRWLREKNVTNS